MISILVTIYLWNSIVWFIVILILSVPTNLIHKQRNEHFKAIEIETTTVDDNEEHVNGKKIAEDANETEITYILSSCPGL